MQLYTCSNSTASRISCPTQTVQIPTQGALLHLKIGERKMGSNEEWRRNADTHKMKPEDVKAAGVEASKRPPGHHPGTVLHQRRSLPYSFTTMTIAGIFIVGAIGYLTLYTLKKPEASAKDVAKVVANVAEPEDTKPKK